MQQAKLNTLEPPQASVQSANCSVSNSPAEEEARVAVDTRLDTSRQHALHHVQGKPFIQQKCGQQIKENYYPPLLSTNETISGLEPPVFGSPHSQRAAGAGGGPATQHFYNFMILSFGQVLTVTGDTALTQSSANKAWTQRRDRGQAPNVEKGEAKKKKKSQRMYH